MNTLPPTADTARSVIDARFAGGAITVAPAPELVTDQPDERVSIPTVRVTIPGLDLALFPHEADALAAALTAAANASRAIRDAILRRSAAVDDVLCELEN